MEKKPQLNIDSHPQYTYGLLKIMEVRQVSLKEAFEIAIVDLQNVDGDEHIKPTTDAYLYLKNKH